MGNGQLIRSWTASTSSLPLLVGMLEGGHMVEISYTAGVKCKLDATASEFPKLAAVIQDIDPSATVAIPLAAAPSVAVAQDNDPSATVASPLAAVRLFAVIQEKS
jgi:hypothetical protein